MAPTYAIIFMHMFEKKALASALYSPFIWVRFIDDIWSVWLHGLDKLREFVYYLNSRHPRITFTWEASESSVNFLDVTTVLTGSSISTDLFIKPTDTHQYLHPTSCHPGHIKRAIPYSQALRILNICSNVQKAEEHLDKLVHNLVCRGHSKRKIQIQVNKAKRKFLNPQQPKEISTPQDTPKPQRIPLVLTYHPGLPNISAITRRYLPVLHLNQSMKLLCPDPPLIAFRRPPNLRQSLIRAQVPPLSTTKPAPFTCGPCSKKGPKKGRKCLLCPFLPEQPTICSSSTSKTHPLRLSGQADCDSKLVVYAITCTLCTENNQYVGQTTNFRKRMNNHRSCIRRGRRDEADCALLYAHFLLPGHSPDTLRFTILQSCPDVPSLLDAETRWIWKLNTTTPNGLNTQDAFRNVS